MATPIGDGRIFYGAFGTAIGVTLSLQGAA
jgi:hypothetical protein